ncbi:putative recA DNA recombination family protein [Zea mays]|uniref:DNA repair protein recA homolog 3 mitochondrial n=2 Tax=Zea mays TaxID=4577 RepID=C0PM38_MAIZE|nr:putative recA DNA recombination family protein [Zea mays]ACN36254.1 unknown [Zea mays]|eukprot:NP_001170211.1 putative recA DNA recombination family protein [Zea mays]
MTTLLRRASLRRVIAAAAASSFHPESYKQGICGSTFHCREFASKAKKKSSGTDSGEENMSKKDLALHQAIDQITSAFGKGAIMWLGRSQGHRDVPVVSTGSLDLDMALGTGGLPKGRVVEVYGPEASGKTTLALHVIAEAQKNGGYCAFVDAEHALDPALAESIGVDTNNLLLSQPDCAEQALSLVDTLIRSGSVDVVVVDSVAALVPKTELDGEMGDAHIALQARLMSQALRKLSHSLSLSQTILLFINQIRAKVATFGFGGPTEVTSGGNALKFYASVRLNIRRIGLVKKGEETIGSQIAVKIVKNKHAPPFKTAQFELEFGKGICRSSELFELGLKHKLIRKSGGSYYSFNGKAFNGKSNLKSYLTENKSVANDLEMELKRLMGTDASKEQEAGDSSQSDFPEESVTPEASSEEDLGAIIEG